MDEKQSDDDRKRVYARVANNCHQTEADEKKKRFHGSLNKREKKFKIVIS